MALWFLLLCATCVLAYAMLCGVFLAFSDFLMRSFDRVPGQGGIRSMQILNAEIMRSIFMLVFIGLVPVSLAVAVYAGLWLEGLPARLLMFAGASYLVGVFILTAAGNVPLNYRLDAMDASAPETVAFWKETYMTRWVTLNSLRTLACFLASGSALAALIIR